MSQSIDENVSRLVDEWANEKRAHTTADLYRSEIEVWSSLSGIESVETACEIGCGSGLFLLTAYAAGLIEDHAIGIDPCLESGGTSQAELAATRDVVDELGVSDSVRYEYGLFPDNMPDEEFELLISRKTFDHIYGANEETREAFVTELMSARRNHLTDGGYIYFVEGVAPSVPKRMAWSTYRSKIQGKGAVDWEEKRSRVELQEILRDAGFQDVKMEKKPMGITDGLPAGDWIGKRLSIHYVISARADGP